MEVFLFEIHVFFSFEGRRAYGLWFKGMTKTFVRWVMVDMRHCSVIIIGGRPTTSHGHSEITQFLQPFILKTIRFELEMTHTQIDLYVYLQAHTHIAAKYS